MPHDLKKKNFLKRRRTRETSQLHISLQYLITDPFKIDFANHEYVREHFGKANVAQTPLLVCGGKKK